MGEEFLNSYPPHGKEEKTVSREGNCVNPKSTPLVRWPIMWQMFPENLTKICKVFVSQSKILCRKWPVLGWEWQKWCQFSIQIYNIHQLSLILLDHWLFRHWLSHQFGMKKGTEHFQTQMERQFTCEMFKTTDNVC